MSAVDEYQTATEALADSTAREALAIYANHLSGELPPNETALLIAALINRANASAVTLADVWLAVQIEEATGQPVPTVGVLPVDDSERLVKAATTVLSDTGHLSRPLTLGPDDNPQSADAPEADPEPAETRLTRLARSEPLETAQRATHEAMQAQPLVEGWIRHMDADPCQLCRWWWREGRIWPKAHRMPTHKGCNCQPRVVLAEHIQSTGYTRRLERNT